MSNRAPGGFPQGYLGRSQNGTEFCWFPTINSWMVFKGKFCKIPRKKYSWMTTRTRKKIHSMKTLGGFLEWIFEKLLKSWEQWLLEDSQKEQTQLILEKFQCFGCNPAEPFCRNPTTKTLINSTRKSCMDKKANSCKYLRRKKFWIHSRRISWWSTGRINSLNNHRKKNLQLKP